MLDPLEHVCDHQNPLADTPALVSCQAPQLRRPRFAAKKVCRHTPSPQTWYVCSSTLPHLGITGSRYEIPVTLPPGWAKLTARPVAMGSPEFVTTIGMSPARCL